MFCCMAAISPFHLTTTFRSPVVCLYMGRAGSLAASIEGRVGLNLLQKDDVMIDHLRLTRLDGSDFRLDDVQASGDVRQHGATIELTIPTLG
jgi:hypothetical protein